MNTNKIIASIIKEDLVSTKNLVNEALLSRLGNALEEKLANFAPSVIGEGSKPDFLDLDKDGNKKEPMKKAAKEAKNVSEGWTDDIPDGETLAKYLSNYANTGKMPKQLSNYYAANPTLGDSRASVGVDKGGVVANTGTGTERTGMAINAGYEPDLAAIYENFEQDVIDLVQEIQEDTGEILSEEEIAELAEEYLNQLLSDEE
jgi:hypothetical protein